METAPRPVVERRELIESIPAVGFTEDQQQDLFTQMYATGLPVSNVQTFVRRANDRGHENVAGHWAQGRGEFAVYDLALKDISEQRLAVIVHEGAHANTPRHESNAHLFGGEDSRQEALMHVTHLAEQSLQTGKFIDGYHANLAERLRNPKHPKHIDKETFIEETWAIYTEHRLTNPAKLAQVQVAQQRAIERNPRKFKDIDGYQALISPPESSEATGLESALITLLDGVENKAELQKHVATLSRRAAGFEESAESMDVAEGIIISLDDWKRQELTQRIAAMLLAPAGPNNRIVRFRLDADRDNTKQKLAA